MSLARPARATLRRRLVAAFILSSLATLAAAALVLLPVLEHRLISDRLTSLRELAATARPALRAIPPDQLHPQARAVRVIADNLQRRTGGRVLIYDDATLLVATPRGRPTVPPARLRAEAVRAARSDRVVAARSRNSAYAIATVRDGPERVTLILTKPLDDPRAAAAVVRAATPGALAAGVLVAAGLALILSRQLSHRLARLRDDATALGAEGLHHRVAVDGDDEVAVVASALEDLRVRLQAEEASRQAFVSTASHELRTPLASLQATLELLREEAQLGAPHPGVVADRAETALRQTHRLAALTTDLLDLSRIDGDAPLHPDALEVSEVVRAVALAADDRLRAEGRALRVEGGPAVALADAAALARIVGVLLDNACRYGSGTVTVAVASDAPSEAVTIAVADEGPGVTADERTLIFGRFARGRAAAGTSGTGLGLPIARGLARAMNGDVTAVGDAHGARFVVRLPAWREEPAVVTDGAAPLPVVSDRDHEAPTTP